MRLTRQRKIILSEIQMAEDHPGADEVYHRVRKTLPSISLGTVYRNLELLVDSGLIRKVEMGSGQRRYDRELHDHGHFRCTSCGNIEDMPFDISIKRNKEAFREWERGRIVEGNNVEYFGICRECVRSNGG